MGPNWGLCAKMKQEFKIKSSNTKPQTFNHYPNPLKAPEENEAHVKNEWKNPYLVKCLFSTEIMNT